MSELESQVAALLERVATLEARVDKMEKGGAAKRPASRPTSAAAKKRPASAASSKSGVKRSASKTSVKSRASTRSASSDFKKADVPEELQGSYFVGKRKVPYLLPDTMLGQKASPDAPKTELELEYVHGYNGRSCRQNIKALGDADGSFVYVIAATGVVHNPRTKEQRYFNGHNEDIVSFAAHPSKPIVATGQLDPKGAGKPYVCVWDYSGAPKEVGRLVDFHDRGVCAIAFSADGSQMITVGMDDNHTVGVWDTPSGGKTVKKPKMSANGSKSDVLDAAFSPSADSLGFITVGVGAIKVWQVVDGRLKSNTVSVMGKSKEVEKSFLSVRYLADGRAVVGGKSGKVYVLGPDGKLAKTLKGHAKDVGALAVSQSGEKLYTAGGERVIQWSAEDLSKEGETEMKSRPVAMDENGSGGLVVGTFGNSVFEIEQVGAKAHRVVAGHSGEIWGLAVHPSQDVFATGAHDKTVRVWDAKSKECTASFSLPAPAGKKSKDAVRSLAFSPDGSQLAVGTRNGGVLILAFPSLEVSFQKSLCKEQVDALNYSPNGQLLAAGSWDQTTVLLDTSSKRTVTLKGHTSSITHLTFSADSKYLSTNSRDYEVLYWDCETGKRVNISVTREVEWHDWQNVLGWPVRGVFGEGMDGTDINAVNVSKNGQVIAAGDDFGLVHLFKYPALHAKPNDKTFVGHSSHVTNVRFSHDDQFLFSCGGLDYGVFQWRHK